MQPLDTPLGMFTGDDVRGALRPAGRSLLAALAAGVASSRRRTWRAGGCGRWRSCAGVVEVAREAGLRLHMDGARLMNAVVASGVPASEMTAGFDTAWLDFTKGLGAPLGACLAGSAELIDEAWRYKQMLGGAMRQAGIVAAGALYALDHNVDRLAEDHANARGARARDRVARARRRARSRPTSSSSSATTPSRCAPRWRQHEVRMGAVGPRRVRAVTHLDVDADGIQTALNALELV